MLASQIIASARRLLNDLGAVRWTDADLLQWLNAAQRQVVVVRPDAKSVRADIELAAGIEQSIPANGIRFLSAFQNVDGRAVTLITRDELNAIDVNWTKATAKPAARHYCYDADTPRAFDVWPPILIIDPVPKLRIAYAVLPTDCATVGAAIDIDDVYEGPLTDFICYRCFMEDTDSPQAGARAANHLAAFMQALTGKTQADQATQPRRK